MNAVSLKMENREDIWTWSDFPIYTALDKDFVITLVQYEALKASMLGTKVKTRDQRVTDEILQSWGMTCWKEYVLDRILTNY